MSLLLLALGGQQKSPWPELIARPGDWIQGQTSLRQLRGKVVLIDFWDYTCVNCIRTFPYLKAWYRRYKPFGFEIVAVHTPEFEFAKPAATVRAAVRRFGFTFPILNDPREENWNRYRVVAWPTKVLLSAQGIPIWSHMGEGEYQRMEELIQREILKGRPTVKMPPLMGYLYDVNRPGAVCYPCTKEIFAGSRGIREGRVVYGASHVSKVSDFSLPTSRKAGVLYLEGRWQPKPEWLETEADVATASLRYNAKDVNAVLRSPAPATAFVLQDGRPLAKEHFGSDIKLVRGRAAVQIREARMYSLVKNAQWGKHELTLQFMGRGIQLFAFSFSTDCMYLPKPRR